MKNYITESYGNIAQSRRLSAILPLTRGIIILKILLCPVL